MPLKQEWWNPVLGVQMRITSNGKLERLESKISTAGRSPTEREGRKWVSMLDGHISDNDRGLLEEPMLKNKPDLIDQLLYELHPPNKIKSKEHIQDRANSKKRLDLLSSLELLDARKKLKELPLSKQKQYRQDIHAFIDKREDLLSKHYPVVLGSEEMGNQIQVSRIGNLTSKYKDLDGNMTAVQLAGSDSKHASGIISVLHPKAGRLLFYQSKAGGWMPFDGITQSKKSGNIYLDEVRSNLLNKYGLAPHIAQVTDTLNNAGEEAFLYSGGGKSMDRMSHLERAQQRQRNREGVETLDSPAEFNKKYTNGQHMPTDILSTERLKHLEDILKNHKFQQSNIKKVLRDNPKAIYALFNDVSNLDPSQIGDLAYAMNQHHFLSAGHSDLVVGYEEGAGADLFDLIDNRNKRADEDESKKDEVTGYIRPVFTSGVVVPYDAMTGKEKSAYRTHWDNTNGRAEAWLQHTTEGQDMYNETLEKMREGFDLNAFRERIAEDVGIQVQVIGTRISISGINDDNTFQGVEGAAKGLTLLEIADRFDEEEIFRDLSDTQVDIIDKLNEHSDFRLAFGTLDVSDDQFTQQFKTQTLDYLLGKPLRASADDWRRLEESGKADTGMITIGGQEYPRDELHRRRLNGRLITKDNQRVGVHKGFTFEDLVTGEIITPHPAIGLYGETGDTYAGSLSQHLGASILDQFVRDGLIAQEYASSSDVVKNPMAPDPPAHGSDDMLARIAFLATAVKDYPNIRGLSNEEGLFPYEKDTDDPLAEMAKIKARNGSPSIVDILEEKWNDITGLKEDDEGYIRAFVSDDIRNQAADEVEDVARGGKSIEELIQNPEQIFRREHDAGELSPEEEAKIKAFEDEIGDAYDEMREARQAREDRVPEEAPKGQKDQDLEERRAVSVRNREQFLRYKKNYDDAYDKWMELNDRLEDFEASTGVDAPAGGGVKPPDKPTVADEVRPEDDEEDANGLTPKLRKAKDRIDTAKAFEQIAREAESTEERDMWSARAAEHRKAGSAWTSYIAMKELNDDPEFQAYRERVRAKQASEVLQNAPINIRATAFRIRLAGIQERMKTATTLGETHDLARELIRAGVVEHSDMIQLDKDGASQLRQLGRQLEEAGVDFTIIDKELQDHRDTVNDRNKLVDGLREYHGLLMGSGLVPDPTSEEEWTPEQQETWARLQGIHSEIMNLEANPVLSYGSEEHVEKLKTDPDTATIYRNLDTAMVSGTDMEWLNNYARLKDTKNVVADSLSAGLNTWRESRLLGNSRMSSMLQMLASTIGEGTGYGADKLRGMDITKPIDSHRAEAGGSWLDWPLIDPPNHRDGIFLNKLLN